TSRLFRSEPFPHWGVMFRDGPPQPPHPSARPVEPRHHPAGALGFLAADQKERPLWCRTPCERRPPQYRTGRPLTPPARLPLVPLANPLGSLILVDAPLIEAAVQTSGIALIRKFVQFISPATLQIRPQSDRG